MKALAGRRILVPESRELDLFADILERGGAVALRCPLVAIHDLEDTAPVSAWIERLVAGAFDDLVLFTGEGLRRILGVAERSGRREPVVAALNGVRRIVRGPKPTRVLRGLGLAPDITAAEPTSAGLLATLAPLSWAGRRVALQLYPGQSDDVAAFFRSGGAEVETVLPYRYASDREDQAVAAAIEAMAAGDVDMIAFTSSPQIRRLLEVARIHGRDEALQAAMRTVAIASIGPITTQAVEKAGWHVAVAPPDVFHLKPMVTEIAKLFAARVPA